MAHPTIYKRPETLAKFRQPATLKDAEVSTYIAKRLLADGLIEKSGKVLTGNRGRPAITFVLTNLGHIALTPNIPVTAPAQVVQQDVAPAASRTLRPPTTPRLPSVDRQREA